MPPPSANKKNAKHEDDFSFASNEMFANFWLKLPRKAQLQSLRVDCTQLLSQLKEDYKVCTCLSCNARVRAEITRLFKLYCEGISIGCRKSLSLPASGTPTPDECTAEFASCGIALSDDGYLCVTEHWLELKSDALAALQELEKISGVQCQMPRMKTYHEEPKGDDLLGDQAPLRFAVGSTVYCNVENGWKAGKVICHGDEGNAYRVKLFGGNDVWAPTDEDGYIRASPPHMDAPEPMDETEYTDESKKLFLVHTARLMTQGPLMAYKEKLAFDMRRKLLEAEDHEQRHREKERLRKLKQQQAREERKKAAKDASALLPARDPTPPPPLRSPSPPTKKNVEVPAEAEEDSDREKEREEQRQRQDEKLRLEKERRRELERKRREREKEKKKLEKTNSKQVEEDKVTAASPHMQPGHQPSTKEPASGAPPAVTMVVPPMGPYRSAGTQPGHHQPSLSSAETAKAPASGAPPAVTTVVSPTSPQPSSASTTDKKDMNPSHVVPCGRIKPRVWAAMSHQEKAAVLEARRLADGVEACSIGEKGFIPQNQWASMTPEERDATKIARKCPIHAPEAISNRFLEHLLAPEQPSRCVATPQCICVSSSIPVSPPSEDFFHSVFASPPTMGMDESAAAWSRAIEAPQPLMIQLHSGSLSHRPTFATPPTMGMDESAAAWIREIEKVSSQQQPLRLLQHYTFLP